MTAPDPTFRREGYMAFPAALDASELVMLRDVCRTLLDEPIDDGGEGRHRIGLGEARRFLAHRHEEFPEVEAFLLSNKIDRIARLSGRRFLPLQRAVRGEGRGQGS